MYKVFLNDRIIKIGALEKLSVKENTVTFNEHCSTEDIRKWYNAFETSTIDEIGVAHKYPEEFFSRFQSAFTRVRAAGGVVIADEKLLVIFRNGMWDLPKGKFEKNESAEEAALREVEEETGIVPIGIDFRLPSTYHIYKSPYPETENQWVFKETEWFQMSCRSQVPGIPQKEEGITQVKWIAFKDLEEVLQNTYKNLWQLINLYRK